MISLTTFNQFAVAAIPLAGFVTALTQLIKVTFPKLSSQYVPLVSVIFGILVSLAFVNVGLLGVTVGVALGLMSVGLWEFGSNTLATPAGPTG